MYQPGFGLGTRLGTHMACLELTSPVGNYKFQPGLGVYAGSTCSSWGLGFLGLKFGSGFGLKFGASVWVWV